MISSLEISDIIRKITKTNYWQTLYMEAKEIGSISLFRNVTDFTSIQIEFLNNLSTYHSIFFDIAMGDVNDVILEDEIYIDAYIYFKNRDRKKKKVLKDSSNNTMDLKSKIQKEELKETDQFIFRTSKKG